MHGKNGNTHPQLLYPFMPPVNVGNKKKMILVPMELIEIVPGQARTRSVTGDISAQIIKHAAMLPNDRFKNISETSSLFAAMRDDQDADRFGLGQMATAITNGHGHSSNGNGNGSNGNECGPKPMRVLGTILPPPKLQYGNSRTVDPQLKGTWNMGQGMTFAHPAPQLADSSKRGASPTR